MSKQTAMTVVPTIEDTKTLLNYNVSPEDAQLHRKNYEKELSTGIVDPQTKFQHAWCLIHSSNRRDFKQAAVFLEELFKGGNEEIKRDSLFYLAVAETKLKNYVTAKKYVKAFLSVEPENVQAEQLNAYIDSQLKKDGITGMALVGAATLFGGAAAIVIGTVAIGAAISFAIVGKRHK